MIGTFWRVVRQRRTHGLIYLLERRRHAAECSGWWPRMAFGVGTLEGESSDQVECRDARLPTRVTRAKHMETPLLAGAVLHIAAARDEGHTARSSRSPALSMRAVCVGAAYDPLSPEEHPYHARNRT